MQAPIAEPPAFGSKVAQPLAELTVIATRGGIAVSLWRNADQCTCAPLRIALLIDCPGHDHSPGTERQKFFPRASRSVATSSIDSANSFFSLRFSSSSAFNLRASDTSMPAYFVRQV